MLPLGELQLRFLGALDPASPPIDAALLAAVNGTGSLDAAQRIRIYADMYRARLVDVLREDYPRVAATVGDADFAALACRYLTRHPSTNPSVRHVGRRFADWIAEEATVAPHAGRPGSARVGARRGLRCGGRRAAAPGRPRVPAPRRMAGAPPAVDPRLSRAGERLAGPRDLDLRPIPSADADAPCR